MLTTHWTGLIAHTSCHLTGSLLAFQTPDPVNGGSSKLVLFVGIAAFALLIQALILLSIFIAAIVAAGKAAKTQRELAAEITLFRAKAEQLLTKSDTLITDLTPQVKNITEKINTITGHVEHLAALVHQKADEISPTVTKANQTVLAANETVLDANLKTRAQISRVNSIVSGALDATVRLGVAIEQGIAKPGREVAGIVAGLKAGFDTLLSGARAFGSGPQVGQRGTPAKSGPVPVYQPAAKPAATRAATIRKPASNALQPRTLSNR